MERYSYDVLGEPNRVSSVDNPYLFTGRRYDPEMGLYYYRARYYNPPCDADRSERIEVVRLDPGSRYGC